MIDPQSSQISSAFAIDAAGITDLRYPFSVASEGLEHAAQTVTATWSIAAGVAKTERGTHMSRFIAGLEHMRQQPQTLTSLQQFAARLLDDVQSTDVEIGADFCWFMPVAAPVTGAQALLDHRVVFSVQAGQTRLRRVRMQVAAKSVCPCSKAISERGAHNQRSLITATVDYRDHAAPLALESLSDILQNTASSPVYPLLKRADEKYVTEAAFDQAVFVEDIARNVAVKLSDISAIARFVVEVRNLESIHSHDCFARISHQN